MVPAAPQPEWRWLLPDPSSERISRGRSRMSRAAASAFAWAEAAAGATVVLGLDVVLGLAVVVVAAVVVLAAVVAVVPALCADADTVGRPSASAARADMPIARRVVPLRFFPRCRCPYLTVVMPNLLLVPTAPC